MAIVKICPKCKKSAFDNAYDDWFIMQDGVIISHSIDCDDVHLKGKTGGKKQ